MVYRNALNEQMFKFILTLIPTVKQNQNRLIILKNKLCSFATTDEAKKTILQWKAGTLEPLNGIEMTVGQKWSTVIKAFTLKDLSVEDKEKLYEEQRAADPTDTAKNHRLTCDALLASKEEFQKHYLSFKDKDNSASITAKNYLAKGWNHPSHLEWLSEYK